MSRHTKYPPDAKETYLKLFKSGKSVVEIQNQYGLDNKELFRIFDNLVRQSQDLDMNEITEVYGTLANLEVKTK